MRVASFACSVMLGLGGVAGCADPTYGPPQDVGDGGLPTLCTAPLCDAAVRTDSGPVARDAQSAPDTSVPQTQLPKQAQALPGTYAVRVRYFINDLPAKAFSFPHEMVFRAEIHSDGTAAGLALDLELCSHTWQLLSGDGTRSDALVVHPDKWPRRSYELHYEDDHFETTGDPLPVGYDPVLPANCIAGASIPKLPGQTWISGAQCDCPSSSAPPTSLSDCRVVDTDDDGRAGLTVQTTSSSTQILGSTRDLESSRYVSGTIASNGKHTAQFFAADDYYVLACDPSTLGCLNFNLTFCLPKLQPVLFEPLASQPAGAASTCADILTQYAAKALFTSDPLIFPSGC